MYKQKLLWFGYGIIFIACLISLYFGFKRMGMPLEYGGHSRTSMDLGALKDKENIVAVAIIGSGPAGLSAALYAARGKLYTVVFEGRQPGGQLTKTSWVENWPGMPKTMGADLIKGAREQAQQFGAVVIPETIESVDFSTWPFVLINEDGEKIHALTVIIATGANPRKLGVPGEEKFWGRGVTTCAICDAPFYKGSDVVVVGGGDSAVEEAMQLAPYVKSATLLVRGDTMRAAPSMQERLKEYKHISVVYNTQITEIKGDDKHVNAVELLSNGMAKTLPIDGVFLAIGHDPNTQLVKKYITCDDAGYIILNKRNQATSIKGIFAAGDVADNHYRQAGVAAGDGIKAALDAAELLRDIGFNDAISDQLKSHFFEPEETVTTVSLKKIVTKQDFEREVVKSKIPVVLDFYTDNCPSCLQMMPAVEAVAGKLANQVTFLKVDALESLELAKHLVVPRVPTLVVFKNGAEVARTKDIMSKQQLLEYILKLASK